MDKKIRNLRVQKQLSQRDLAKLAGVQQATLSRIESGKLAPSIKTLNKIARALKVHAGKLL